MSFLTTGGLVSSLLLALAQAMVSAATQPTTQDTIRVTLQDGSRLLIRDWTFLYSWGESDRAPEKRGVFYFSPLTSRTRDLLVRKPKRGSSWGDIDARIPGGMLAAMTLRWEEAVPSQVRVELVDGEVIALVGQGSFQVSERLLSSKGYIHSVSLNLEGKPVDANSSTVSWPLVGRGPRWDPKGTDTVVSIDFRLEVR